MGWAALQTVDQASPNFILQLTFGLQFTFSCNSLVNDPGLRETTMIIKKTSKKNPDVKYFMLLWDYMDL